MKPEQVRAILESAGLSIEERHWELLLHWTQLLADANRRLNLVSRHDESRIWERHLLPSLALLVFRNIPRGIEFCDFGTGGGFPGMPIAMVRPDLNVTLIDSRRKKIAALKEMASILQLRNVEAVCGRGEELGNIPPWSGRYPVLAARAVAPLVQLERWTRGLRKKDAVLHVFKGGNLDEEIRLMLNEAPQTQWSKTLLSLPAYDELAKNRKSLITLDFSGD